MRGVSAAFTVASKRVPGRRAAEFKISHIDAKPSAQSGADRHHYHVVRDRGAHAEAADHVGRAVEREKATVQGVCGWKVVHEHHRAGAFTPEAEADRRPLPENGLFADIAEVDCALAVAQATDEGAGGLLTENVAIRLAPPLHRLLDCQRNPARDRAEELVARVDELGRIESSGIRFAHYLRRSRVLD